MTELAPLARKLRMSRHPSDAALTQAAGGDWLNQAACRSQPAFTDQDPDVIAVTCSRCRAATDCAKLGRLELARALGDRSDSGEQRVYAGHQLADLLLLARSGQAGRAAAYQALTATLQRAAGFDLFGYNCDICGRPSAFINDNGRCTRPACREAKA